LPQRLTPRKEKSFEGFRTNRTPKKGLKYVGNKERDERLPRWLAPTVRAMCRGMDAGKAVPHVLAGVESVLCLPCPREQAGTEGGKQKMEGKLPALVAAVLFFAMTRLAGEETNGKEYLRQRKLVLDILAGMRDDAVVVGKVGDGEGGWLGWEVVRDTDIDAWLKDLPKRGWLEMDWFQNIVEGSGADGGAVDDDYDMDEGSLNPDKSGKEILRAGLGTMRQDKFDYLSEAKRNEYAEWKAEILLKIDVLIAGGIMDNEMDTAEG
jgi:origin recognition complex subunit 6